MPISTHHTNIGSGAFAPADSNLQSQVIASTADEVGPILAFANYFAPHMQVPANDVVELRPALGLRVVAISARADFARVSKGGLAPGALRRVREHVESHLAEKIGLIELAAIAKLSDCHFSRVFKQSVGVSPHRYIMTRRIATAARLMQDSDRPLIEISHAVGFSDQSHFTRVFVDVMGETPRAFKWRHR